MSDVAVLVPVLARPHRVEPLFESIAAATPGPHRVYFIPDPDDDAELTAIRAAGGEIVCELRGNYAEKINAGVRLTDEPLILTGADDLAFRPGWLEAARAHLTGGVEVVGVNDLIERRPERQGHATHFLMTRRYAELPAIDGRPGPLHEGYSHSFVDDELIATAKHRGAYAYAKDAVVEHLHVMNGTAPDDDTYRKGRARFRQDRRLFHARSRLWTT